MQTLSKPAGRSSALADNAIARDALEAIQQIDRESREKKNLQVQSLQSAKVAIERRIEELNRQIAQIDTALASINGRPLSKEKRSRRNWEEDRERVARWMQGHKGQKFGAGDLIREFPELDGMIMTVFLKPLIQEGSVQMDTGEGIRRAKYFVVE